MKTFYIHESNMERLEKKLATLEKKCNTYQFSFTFNKVDEIYKEVTTETGESYLAKYIVVEVEGEVKFANWEFVATLDHHAEGNVIRSFETDLVIPEKYRTCGPTCEHCNKIRSRKDTYLIHNNETDEWKQVGKNCLQEFTNGLDAESVARLVEMYEKLDDAYGYGGSGYTCYHNVEDCLRYAFECFRHFGYEKSYYDEYSDYSRPVKTTRERVSDYMAADSGCSRWLGANRIKELRDEMGQVGFDAMSEYAVNTSKAAREWITSLNDDEIDNQYIRNLKLICLEDYTESRNYGIMVSLTAAYSHEMDRREKKAKREAERKARAEKEAVSDYVGNIKDRLTISTEDFKCIKSFDTMYGTTFLYKFTDSNNNIFEWFASNPVADPELVRSVTGTVKDHSEYCGVKQTILTRCKVEHAPKADKPSAEGAFNLDEALDLMEQFA